MPLYKSSKPKKKKAIPCPKCGQTASVGFLTGGSSVRFFCCECNIEYKESGKLIEIYFIEEDGTLILVEEEIK